ncbi:S4 domain-containing protein [Thauera sp.]|uniref:S4 domain-containing protein n=1 Tax=Thauera sp. TaxID=1905334 RepID=UPI0039E39CF8
MSMNSFHARQGRPRQAAETRVPIERHGMLRADQLLVAQGLAPSRTAARALIEAGRVSHEGQPLAKPAQVLPPDAELTVAPDDSDRFVSRGALKLEGALARSGLDVHGAVCLDVGQFDRRFHRLPAAGRCGQGDRRRSGPRPASPAPDGRAALHHARRPQRPPSRC